MKSCTSNSSNNNNNRLNRTHERPNSEGFTLVVSNFQAETDYDISIQQGELVKVLNIDNDNWAWVSKDDNKEGFVPLTSLSIDEGKRTEFKI